MKNTNTAKVKIHPKLLISQSKFSTRKITLRYQYLEMKRVAVWVHFIVRTIANLQYTDVLFLFYKKSSTL